MSPGTLTRIGPLLAFARSKSRWTLMPSPFRNPWSHAGRSAWAKTRASPAEVRLTGTGEGTPRSSSGELGNDSSGRPRADPQQKEHSMSSTANPQRARKSCEWLDSPNLILSTASLLLIFLFWPPVARTQLLSPFPHSSGTISGTVLVAEENRPAGGLRVQVKSFAGGLAATAVTDAFGRFQVF